MIQALSIPNDMMIRKIESIVALSDEERQAIKHLPIKIVDMKAYQDIVNMGDHPTQCFMVLEGFACVYKETIDGNRQILAIHIPGDMPDLQSLHLPFLDINIATLSACKLGFVQHEDARRICEQYPRLATAFWRETLSQSAIYREWIVNNGRRKSYTRIAHLICELKVRLNAVGLVRNNRFIIPASQAELADATGMTPVHMNRVLQELRADGLIKVERSSVSIPDWEALKLSGEFDPLYLHFVNEVA
nr:Crp/Fnr family transcriptional regulator [Halomonas sp. UBA3074]